MDWSYTTVVFFISKRPVKSLFSPDRVSTPAPVFWIVPVPFIVAFIVSSRFRFHSSSVFSPTFTVPLMKLSSFVILLYVIFPSFILIVPAKFMLFLFRLRVPLPFLFRVPVDDRVFTLSSLLFVKFSTPFWRISLLELKYDPPYDCW